MSHVTTLDNIGMWGIKNVTGKAQLPQKSPVTCHMLLVTCHMSHVTCQMSHVTTFGNIGMWGVKNVTGKAQLP